MSTPSKPNRVVVSEDGRTAVVTNPDHPGWKMQIRSRRPEGFQPQDLWNAQDTEQRAVMEPGQKTVSRRKVVGPWVVYVHLLTGPPTWWLPLVSFKRPGGQRRLLVGWLRGAVAIAVSRRKDDDE